MLDYEQQVCGILMYSPKRYAHCVDVGLSQEHFIDHGYRRIFACISDIAFDDDAATKMTGHLWAKCPESIQLILNSTGVLDQQLTIESAVQGLFDSLSKRKWEASLLVAIAEVKAAKTSDEIEQAKARFLESMDKTVTEKSDKYANKDYQEVMLGFIDSVERNIQDFISGKKTKISTGFKQLDKPLHGFLPGALYILAARTGMGKTTLAINLAESVLNQGHGVLFFSNEMSAEQIATKHVSLVARVKSQRIQEGNLNQDEVERIHAAVKSKFESRFIINEFAGTNFQKFKAQLRLAVKKYDVKVVFHDYIQQMFIDGASSANGRVQELSRISSEIKTIARELGISIVCLAQLNRKAEESANNGEAPNISQIKDSGAMEQDADAVLIIHRKRDTEDEGTEIIVAKNRFNYVTGGGNGNVILRTNLSMNRFYEDR